MVNCYDDWISEKNRELLVEYRLKRKNLLYYKK